ncbi:MAG: class I SAM-dependent methyltransferase [Methanobacterium sp.]|nr:class I SAM-dependent methyltransferase [Methanobacterium sp.]
MCHPSCIVFGAINLKKEDVEGKKVIEIGSYDVNGSIRSIIESLNPAEYMGVDLEEGPGVDRVCCAEEIINCFHEEAFDVVISTEMIEHVKDWRKVISNIKKICKPGGIILLTTRSYGFPFHPSPTDFWRFEYEDMESIFSDCEILVLEKDREFPGVFIKVRKPFRWKEKDLSHHMLYSMITNRKETEITDKNYKNWHFRKIYWKEKIKISSVNLLRFFRFI